MTVEELLDAARAGLIRGDAGESIDTACVAFATGPGPWRPRAAAIVAEGMLGAGLPADAIVWANRALALSPGDGEALAHRGWAHELLGRTAEALSDLDAAVAARPDYPEARLDHAIVAYAAERRADAVADLEAILDDPREGPVARRIRGEWRRDEGDLAGAHADFVGAARAGDTRALERLLSMGGAPDDPQVLLTWARLYARKRSHDTALALVEEVLARAVLPAGLRAQAEVDRGILLHRVGNDAAALIAFASAAIEEPGDASILARYGAALGRSQRLDEALATFDRALEIDPHGYLGLLLRAETLMDAERWEDAARGWSDLLCVAPGHLPALVGLGRALLECGRTDEATSALIGAALAGSASAVDWCNAHGITLPSDHVRLGNAALSGGRLLAAIEHFAVAAAGYLERSRAYGDSAHRHAALALCRGAQARLLVRDHQGAAAQLEEAIEMRPALGEAWIHLAAARTTGRRYDAALAAADQIASIEPRGPAADLQRAEVLRRLGRSDGHLAALSRAAELADDEAVRCDIFRMRARAYQALARWDDALADYRRSAELGDPYAASAIGGIAEIRALAASGPGVLPPARYRSYGIRATTLIAGPELRARIQFATRPEPRVREMIARAAVAAAGGAFRCEGRWWWWSDRFALIRAASPDAGAPATHRALADVVEAIHLVAPLVEVVSWNAAGTSAGDADEMWSIATRPVPDAGPDFAGEVGFWVSQLGDARAYPLPAHDEAFDDAWHDGMIAAEATAAAAHLEATREQRARGEIVLAPIGSIPPAPPLPERVLAALREDMFAVSVASDGRSLAYARGERVYRLDLDTGISGEVIRCDDRVESTAILDSGHLLVKTEEELLILAAGADGVTPVARVAAGPGPVTSWKGGRLVIHGLARVPRILVYGWHRGRLEALAELAAGVDGDSHVVIGDRAYCSSGIDYELLNLEPTSRLYEVWVDSELERRDELKTPGSLTVEELDELEAAPPHGRGDAPPDVRAEIGEDGWYVTGPASLTFGLRAESGQGDYVAVAGDSDGVHELVPTVVSEAFEWSMRDDGLAVLAIARGVLWEFDLEVHTSRRLVERVDRACYTAEGFATLDGGDLVLYRWNRGSEERPTELERIEIEGEVTDLVSTAAGKVVMVGVDDKSLFLAIRGGEVFPIGKIDHAAWAIAWTSGGALYLQDRDDEDVGARRYRVSGATAAWELAVGSLPIDRVEAWAIDESPRVEAAVYPHRTRWSP